MFTKQEKNMMIGALATAGVDAALEGYRSYELGAGNNIRTNPADPLYYVYYTINEWIPPVDTLIADVGIPALFYAVGKMKRSATFKDMAFGGAVYGASDILGNLALKVARAATGKEVAPLYKVM